MGKVRSILGMTALAAVAVASMAMAQEKPAPAAAPARPTFDADGTVNVPAFKLPPSPFLSPEALALQKMRAAMPPPPISPELDIAKARAGVEAMMGRGVGAMRARYPVDFGLLEDLLGGRATDPEDVREADFDALADRDVDSCDTCHARPSPDVACVGGSGRSRAPRHCGG
jgi:hypothetical protein